MSMQTFALILSCCLVTFAMRGPAMVLFSTLRVPDFVRQALPFVPICVLVAIMAPALLAPSGVVELRPWDNAWISAGLAAGLVAAWRKDLVSPVVAGLAVYWLYQGLMAS